MRKFLIAVLLIAALAVCSMPVSAEHYWNYDIKFGAGFGTIEIGSFNMSAWDAAPAINIALNNDPLEQFINYQSGWADARNDSDFSGVYKVMWDENYIYFLEDRNDDHVNLSGDGTQPWMTDGSLIFTQVDSADGTMNRDGVSIHVFYSVGNGSGAIGGHVQARVCNIFESSREVIDIPGAKIASTLKPGGFIVEIAVPWSFYKEYTPAFVPGAGTIMGLSYVVHDSDADDPGHEKQFCYAVDNDMLPDVPGGYDFGGWGTLELLAAPVVTIPAEIVEEAPAPVAEVLVPTPRAAEPVSAAPAPQTNDAIFIFAILAAISAGMIIRKKSTAK